VSGHPVFSLNIQYSLITQQPTADCRHLDNNARHMSRS